MRYLLLTALLYSVACFAGEPGTEQRPFGVIHVPAPQQAPAPVPVEQPPVTDLRTDALKYRDVEFDVPGKAPDAGLQKTPSIGAFVGGIGSAVLWVLDTTLDLTAGTLKTGGQVLTVGTDATLGVLEAGSGAVVDTGSVIESGAAKFTNGAVGLTQ